MLAGLVPASGVHWRSSMADAAVHSHDGHDKPGFFTRWFMSTNHKDIGILYLVTAAILGLVSVSFTMFMRGKAMSGAPIIRGMK